MPRRPAGDPALAAFAARAPATLRSSAEPLRASHAGLAGQLFPGRPDQPVVLIESKAVFARRTRRPGAPPPDGWLAVPGPR